LYGEMTVVDFLTFIASTRRIPASEIKNKIDVSIQRTSLENVINQKIETLSKGFKRRVGLAQAIIHDPEVLILDEPTDGLDPNQKHDVRNLIQSMSVDKSIIVSTHILEEVDAICTRALIISQGKVVADGTPVELKRKATGAGIVILDFTTVEMAEKARSILENVDSSAKVEIHDSSVKLHPKSSKIDVIRDSLKMLDGQDVQVLDLYSEEAQLDEVFRSVTSAHNS